MSLLEERIKRASRRSVLPKIPVAAVPEVLQPIGNGNANETVRVIDDDDQDMDDDEVMLPMPVPA